ncbi:MAG: ParB/RepB/Spo0J family partition protein [Candidatus Thorarchaeota archaeon]
MEYTIQEIPIEQIHNDTEFNCRGHITPLDVKDLADDIRINGLQFPIAIQPKFDVTNLPEPYKYRIIAGHRRFVAFKILKYETIPAMIKSGLSEIDARLMNLSENLKRRDLNILQEAGAVRQLRLLNLTQEDIAEKLGQSRTWVQIRLKLLRLPEPIQEAAAAGFINQAQIRQLHSIKDPDKQLEAARKIKTATIKGQKGISVEKKPQENPDKAKRRSQKEIQDLLAIFISQRFYGLHTRCLAWANGAITTRELFKDIEIEAKKKNIEVNLPSLPDMVVNERSMRRDDIGRWS